MTLNPLYEDINVSVWLNHQYLNISLSLPHILAIEYALAICLEEF